MEDAILQLFPRQVMSHSRIKKEVLKVIGKCVRKEMRKEMVNVGKRNTEFVLRGSVECLDSFSWEKLSTQLQQKTPLFYNIQKMCVSRKRRRSSIRGKTNVIDDNMECVLLCYFDTKTNV